MIVEGLVTTLDETGQPHVTPMGPIVGASWERIVLRPFKSSHTYSNLRRAGEGVFHVTDDVELIARAALGRIESPPAMRPAGRVAGMILVDACRWYAFRLHEVDEDPARPSLVCRVVDRGFQREFVGLCRAKHAVLEAAILATRVHLYDAKHLRDELRRLAPLVEKTGDQAEHRAWELLSEFILAAIDPRA